MITGNLPEDSPSLHSKLKRLFNEQELNEFSTHYNLVCKSPLLLTENTLREVGVNFNPQPARIIEILIEAKITDKSYLEKALTELPKVLEDLELLNPRDFLKYPEQILAIILDELRHLCYISNPQVKYQELLKIYKDLEQLDCPQLPSAIYLSNKLKTAFRQYQKYA